MKTVPPLPKDVADGWFHITAGGEVYESLICRGCDLRGAFGELMFGSRDAEHEELDSIMTEFADPDWWGCHDGKCVHANVACGEDPDIEVRRITDPSLLALLAANNFQTRSLFG